MILQVLLSWWWGSEEVSGGFRGRWVQTPVRWATCQRARASALWLVQTPFQTMSPSGTSSSHSPSPAPPAGETLLRPPSLMSHTLTFIQIQTCHPSVEICCFASEIAHLCDLWRSDELLKCEGRGGYVRIHKWWALNADPHEQKSAVSLDLAFENAMCQKSPQIYNQIYNLSAEMSPCSFLPK